MKWTWAAGMAWIVTAILGGIVAALTILSILFAPLGFGLFVAIVSVPGWLVWQIWDHHSVWWAAFGGVYAISLAALLRLNGSGMGLPILILIPGLLSFLAAWELAYELPSSDIAGH